MPLPSIFSITEIARRIKDLLFRRQDVALKELVGQTPDEELTHIIDALPDGEKASTFRALPPVRRGRVVEAVSGYTRDLLLRALSVDEMNAMIDAVQSDDAVDIIQHVTEPKKARIIADLRKDDPKGILPLLVFDKHTAGGRMKTEVLSFPASKTAEEVRRLLAADASARHKTHYLYFLDEAGALAGTLSPIRLLQTSGDARIADVVNRGFVSVPPTLDQEDVAKLFDEHDAIELPVVGQRGRLLGVITADDVFEVMEEEFEEDVSRLVGVHRDAHIDDPVKLSVSRRMPWLVVNLATAILAAAVVGAFNSVIHRVVVLAAMMPIIAGMGGNAATQTLGVTIRAIALGELHHLNTIKAIGKELAVGAANGVLNGLIMGVVAYFWFGLPALAGIMVVSMTLNLVVAGLGGVLVPVVMKALRIDPALASTVFVTTLTDVCGFFFLLGLASKLL